MKKLLILVLAFCCISALISCGDKNDNESSFDSADTSNMSFDFTEKDTSGAYDTNSATYITLLGTTASISGDGASVSGNKVTVTAAGTYILSGALEGSLEIRSNKNDKIQIVLGGASITNAEGPAVYVAVADKVFFTLAEGSENTLSDAESYDITEDDSTLDAALFSKEDITVNGTGKLTVEGNFKHGIVSKDDLVICGGEISVSSAGVGLSGKDAVKICNASVTVNSGTDAIRAENEEDSSLGYVYIESGNLSLTSENDAVQASSVVKITGGNITVISGGGSVNSSTTSSGSSNPSWDFGGGRPGMGMGGSSSSSSSSNTESAKGIKAALDIIIEGGAFNIDSADDSIHSNAIITVSGGEFSISSGDDGIHADSSLTVKAGNIDIAKSYEGLEATEIFISGGSINIVASDDGLNAAGGSDSSSTMGRPGQNNFSNSNGKINISGGKLYINASGDGIDANGSLEISGGEVTVCGPTSGDTAVLDYDNEGIITGGTFIGTGAYMMAQTFSDSGQGVIALSVGSQAAKTLVKIEDKNGNVIVSYEPKLSYQIVIISTPELKKGETYKVTIGDYSDEFEAS